MLDKSKVNKGSSKKKVSKFTNVAKCYWDHDPKWVIIERLKITINFKYMIMIWKLATESFRFMIRIYIFFKSSGFAKFYHNSQNNIE